MKVSALIMAAGNGKRMGGDTKKQYLKLNNKEILKYTVEVFEKCQLVNEIVIVTGQDDINQVKNMLKEYNKIVNFIAGGSERQYSVYNGLKALNDCDIVLIQDGVRPFVNIKQIETCIEKTMECGACVLGVPVKDTIKICDENGIIKATPDRKTLWAAQTPQCFNYKIILNAYNIALESNFLGTDDASLLELTGDKVEMVTGDYNNIKITTPEDLVMAEAILKNISCG